MDETRIDQASDSPGPRGRRRDDLSPLDAVGWRDTKVSYKRLTATATCFAMRSGCASAKDPHRPLLVATR